LRKKRNGKGKLEGTEREKKERKRVMEGR